MTLPFRRAVFLPALLLCLLPSAGAAPMTHVECSLEGVGSSSGDTSCSVTSPFQFFSTTSDVSFHLDLTSDPADYSVMTFNHQGVAGAYTVNRGAQTQYFGGSASSTLSFTTNLRTAGEVRPGYLQITGYAMGEPSHLVSPSFSYGIPGSAQFSGGNSFTVSGQEDVSGSTTPASIMLGTPFSLFADSSLAVTTDSTTGYPNFGYVQADFEFRFFEADGVTPVQVSETPEAQTWNLIGGSMLLLLGLRRASGRSAK